MGGVVLPGPVSTGKNPAYAAIGDPYGYSTWTLPLGLLGLLLPDRSPLYYFIDPNTFYQSFDLLSFYQQLSSLDVLLLNPSRSPDEVVIYIKADDPPIEIRDGNGNPIRLERGVAYRGTPARALTPPPFLRIPISVGANFRSTFGLFAGVDRLRIYPNPALASLLAGGHLEANQTYEVYAEGGGQSGMSIDFAFATPIPSPPDMKIYVGARGEAFLGLAMAEGETTYRVVTDDEGVPAKSESESRVFYSYLGKGTGYGARLDAGVAVETEAGIFGLGVQNLASFVRWQGTELTLTETERTETPKTLTEAGVHPAIYLNGAAYVPVEGYGKLLVAGDLGYDGSLYGHVGAELPIGTLRVRGGIGYRDGILLGTGVGMALGKFRFDLALTGETAPWDGHLMFGLTAGIGF